MWQWNIISCFRHGRARCRAENLFGILANRWRVFCSTIALPLNLWLTLPLPQWFSTNPLSKAFGSRGRPIEWAGNSRIMEEWQIPSFFHLIFFSTSKRLISSACYLLPFNMTFAGTNSYKHQLATTMCDTYSAQKDIACLSPQQFLQKLLQQLLHCQHLGVPFPISSSESLNCTSAGAIIGSLVLQKPFFFFQFFQARLNKGKNSTCWWFSRIPTSKSAQGESQKQTRSIYPGLSTWESNPNLLLVQSAKYVWTYSVRSYWLVGLYYT